MNPQHDSVLELDIISLRMNPQHDSVLELDIISLRVNPQHNCVLVLGIISQKNESSTQFCSRYNMTKKTFAGHNAPTALS